MVKRKAEKSLEEWLGESGSIPARNQVEQATTKEEHVLPPAPTIEVIPPGGTVELVAAAPAGVVATEEDASKWLWDFLEQSGYERW